MTKPKPNIVLAVPWLDEPNYSAARKMAGKSWNMDADFSTWKSKVEQVLKLLTANGQPFKLMEINAKALQAHCSQHSTPINSKALGDFAAALFNAQLPSPIVFEGHGSLRPHDITISNIVVGRGWGPAVSIKNTDRISVSNIVRMDKPKT